VCCDSLYGRDSSFPADLDAKGVIYMADIPEDTQVHLEKPVVSVPETVPGKIGHPFLWLRVSNDVQPLEVRELVTDPDMVLQPVPDRHAE